MSTEAVAAAAYMQNFYPNYLYASQQGTDANGANQTPQAWSATSPADHLAYIQSAYGELPPFDQFSFGYQPAYNFGYTSPGDGFTTWTGIQQQQQQPHTNANAGTNPTGNSRKTVYEEYHRINTSNSSGDRYVHQQSHQQANNLNTSGAEQDQTNDEQLETQMTNLSVSDHGSKQPQQNDDQQQQKPAKQQANYSIMQQAKQSKYSLNNTNTKSNSNMNNKSWASIVSSASSTTGSTSTTTTTTTSTTTLMTQGNYQNAHTKNYQQRYNNNNNNGNNNTTTSPASPSSSSNTSTNPSRSTKYYANAPPNANINAIVAATYANMYAAAQASAQQQQQQQIPPPPPPQIIHAAQHHYNNRLYNSNHRMYNNINNNNNIYTANNNLPYQPSPKYAQHNPVPSHQPHQQPYDTDDSQQSNAALSKLKVQNQYNPKEFNLVPKGARFFVIKSYSEDDIHRSIKYNIWCSTEHGNRRLDQAFREREGKGPVYLFFSVNGSGHFCGMAEMMSCVDYDSKSDVWSQDKWKGKFDVKWIYVKDVPNSQLRQIRLENNDNKPVTNSRDTQEIPFEKGKQVLKVFHHYRNTTSIFDDFEHYEKRQDEDCKRVVTPTNQSGQSSAAHLNSPQSAPAIATVQPNQNDANSQLAPIKNVA